MFCRVPGSWSPFPLQPHYTPLHLIFSLQNLLQYNSSPTSSEDRLRFGQTILRHTSFAPSPNQNKGNQRLGRMNKELIGRPEIIPVPETIHQFLLSIGYQICFPPKTALSDLENRLTQKNVEAINRSARPILTQIRQTQQKTCNLYAAHPRLHDLEVSVDSTHLQNSTSKTSLGKFGWFHHAE